MIILDIDILTHWLYGNKIVEQRYRAIPEGEVVAITIITYIESLGGRMQSVLKAANEAELQKAAQRLETTMNALLKFPVLHLDAMAIQHVTTLSNHKKTKNMGRADRLIASIALAQDTALVSRNTKDFQDVPGLKLVNWME